MSILIQSNNYQIFNEDCHNLNKLDNNSIDCLVTDPPYGIAFQNHEWDKALPDKKFGKNL
jgi:site-specific DNA-methyltransferase (adenine-specific)